MKNEELGTIIHGIGASEALDSSGERIEIKGVDISSLADTGVINYEHESKTSTQIVGKIIEATKIFSEDDIKNKHHRKFWKLAKETPYIYIKAVLFDKFGHNGAQDVAAILRFDQALDTKDTKRLSGFSIEGSTLDKQDKLIKKSLARKVSFTITPCNKTCIAEILEPEQSEKDVINLASIVAAFKKSEELENDLQKGSLQSRLGSPNKNISKEQRKDLREWQISHRDIARQKVTPIKDGARQRILHKLHSQTQVKKHPKTGERMFLMHRGIGHGKESENLLNNRESGSGFITGWTPDKSVANAFGSSFEDIDHNENGLTISAWIPESQIHHSVNTNIDGNKTTNPHPAVKDEHEYLIKPHKLTLASQETQSPKEQINERINTRSKISRGKYLDTPQETKQKLQDFNRGYKKLAASEKEENSLAKTDIPKYNTNLGFKTKKPESKTRDYVPTTPNQGQIKAGKSWEPSKTVSASSIGPNDKLSSGTRISYQNKQPKSGRAIYNNPDTWKSEIDSMSNTRKKVLKSIKPNLGVMALSEKDSVFDGFAHKDILFASIRKAVPEANDEQVEKIAIAYINELMDKK